MPRCYGRVGIRRVSLEKITWAIGMTCCPRPTAHGFDEFYGNPYHLNAEEEPEHPDYPTNPEFKKKFGPRGVIHSFADGRIADTGPLNKKRMETIDEEVNAKTFDFMERAKKADKPFFIWWNSTKMHMTLFIEPGSP